MNRFHPRERGHDAKAPPPFSVTAMALMWLIGGVLALATVALPHPAGMAPTPVFVVGAAGIVVSVAVFLVGARIWPWVPPTIVAGGTVVVSILVLTAGGGALSFSFALLYGWVVIYAWLFFSVPMATAQTTIAAVAGSTAFAVLDPSPPASAVLIVWGTVAILSIVVVGLQRARELAEVDPLTGVASRRGLDRLLREQMAQASLGGQPLTVAIMDVDHFKAVNDRHGHGAGDRILRAATKAWRTDLRETDWLGRFGGDEFVLVLPGTVPADGHRIADRLRARTPLGVTCSVGVAGYQPGDSLSMLLGRADAALYEAKRAGRDRTVCSGESGVELEEIEVALADGDFVLYFQPVVDLGTGEVDGVEALVRWQHPERGMLPPSEFIPLVENTDLVVSLGEWVLRDACRRTQAWFQEFPDQPLTVAVNVCARQIAHPEFVATVRRVLRTTGLPPWMLVLEITENSITVDAQRTRSQLEKLSAIGVRLAMDDFGTGYSSLSQLRQLPVDIIKIDRSFVADLGESAEADSLIAAIVGIGLGLGRTLVGEGVENVAQLQHLRALGCHQAQGFLLGRPLPPEVVPQLLLRQRRHRVIGDLPHSERMRDVAGLAEAVSRWVEGSGPLGDRVQGLLLHLVEASGLESAYLTRIHWDRWEQELTQVVNAASLQIPEGAVIDWSDTVCRRALETNTPHTSDVQQQFPEVTAALELGLRSYATAPVVLSDGTVFGTLCVAGTRPQTLGDGSMALLTLYSRLIAEELTSPYAT